LEGLGLISLLPFILSIFFLIWQKDNIFPLLGGLFLGSILVSQFNPFYGFINTAGVFIVNALTDKINILTILLIAEGLIFFTLLNRCGYLNTLRKEFLKKNVSLNRFEHILFLSNIVLFIDRNLSAFLIGIFSRPLAEKKRLSATKHAYLLNTVSSSISSLIPFTTLTPIAVASIGIAFTNLGISYSPLKAFYQSLPYQYYNIFALFIVLSTLLLNKDLFVMERYRNARSEKPVSAQQAHSMSLSTLSFGLILKTRKQTNIQTALYGSTGAICLLLGAIVLGYILNSRGYHKLTILNIQNHHVIFVTALFIGIVFSILYTLITKSITYREYKTRGNDVSLAFLSTIFYMVLVMSIESLAQRTGFSTLLVEIFTKRSLAFTLIPLLIFFLSSVVSFLSGSFLFTVSTMLPLALRLISLNLTDPLIVDSVHFATIGSVLSGATFGDTNSPLSLNFIISTAASESSVSQHFLSQIVYSLMAFFIAAVFGFTLLVFGLKPYFSISLGLLVIALIFIFINKDISNGKIISIK
jgi:Na+/H+ antiporter NhaC